MFRLLALAGIVGGCVAAGSATAKTDGVVKFRPNIPIQLRLTNTMAGKVDYFLTPPDGQISYAGSIAAGSAVDIEAREGQVLTFGLDRVPFQTYQVRGVPFQGLTLAPKERQQGSVTAPTFC